MILEFDWPKTRILKKKDDLYSNPIFKKRSILSQTSISSYPYFCFPLLPFPFLSLLCGKGAKFVFNGNHFVRTLLRSLDNLAMLV